MVLEVLEILVLALASLLPTVGSVPVQGDNEELSGGIRD
jgi:hypothetical protein